MDPVGLYALFSGWRIIIPANAFDYIGLFNTAMYSLDPVVIMEHHSLYAKKFQIPKDNLDYCIPFGKARIVAEGQDITIVTYGVMAWRCEQLQTRLSDEGVSAEIIDLRTVDLPSLDFETIGRSLEKTGAAVIVEEAPTSIGIGDKIASGMQERFFYSLDGPIMRLSSLDVPTPVSRVLEAKAMLDDDTIVSETIAAAKHRWK